MPVYVVECPDALALPVLDEPTSPVVFTEEMFGGES
jgi:hypothetical protein